MAIIGIGVYKVLPFYSQMAKMLTSLSAYSQDNPLKNVVSPPTMSKIHDATLMEAAKGDPCNAQIGYSNICENQNSTLNIMSATDCLRLKGELALIPSGKTWCDMSYGNASSNGALFSYERAEPVSLRLR